MDNADELTSLRVLLKDQTAKLKTTEALVLVLAGNHMIDCLCSQANHTDECIVTHKLRLAYERGRLAGPNKG